MVFLDHSNEYVKKWLHLSLYAYLINHYQNCISEPWMQLTSPMAYTEIETVNNAVIISDGVGKYGVKDSNGAITVAIKWDKYSFIHGDSNRRYMIVKQNGKFGIYDTIRLDYIAYCSLSRIDRFDTKNKILYAKEPFYLFGLIPLGNCKVEIPLK